MVRLVFFLPRQLLQLNTTRKLKRNNSHYNCTVKIGKTKKTLDLSTVQLKIDFIVRLSFKSYTIICYSNDRYIVPPPKHDSPQLNSIYFV